MLTDLLQPINVKLLRLRPAYRAAIALVILSAFGTAIWTVVLGATVMSIVWGVWLATLVVYFSFRIGYFSPRVMAQLPGDPRPYPHRVRKTPGNFRIDNWDVAEYLHAEDADELLTPDSRVIGLEVDGAAVAYPLRAMALREIANEDIDGTPVSVTWSPLTYSARVFLARGPDGEPLTLAPTGLTMFNSAMLESENGTQYLQFTGEALVGPDAGHQLQHLPSTMTTWAAWQDAWPDTEAMSVEGSPERDIFESYYASPRAGLFRQPAKDKMLPDKDVILGLIGPALDPPEPAEESTVFSAHVLREDPIAELDLGNRRILVVCERGSATYCIYDSTLKRQLGETRSESLTLSFTSHTENDYRPNRVIEGMTKEPEEDDDTGGTPDADYEPWLLRDQQTGSIWRAVNGTCIEGELAGERLEMLPSRLGFWFAWNKIHADIPLANSRQTDT